MVLTPLARYAEQVGAEGVWGALVEDEEDHGGDAVMISLAFGLASNVSHTYRPSRPAPTPVQCTTHATPLLVLPGRVSRVGDSHEACFATVKVRSSPLAASQIITLHCRLLVARRWARPFTLARACVSARESRKAASWWEIR